MMKSQYLAKLTNDQKRAFDARMDELKLEEDYVELLIAIQAAIEEVYIIIKVESNRPDDDGLQIVKQEFCGENGFFNPANPVKNIAELMRNIPVSHLLLLSIEPLNTVVKI